MASSILQARSESSPYVRDKEDPALGKSSVRTTLVTGIEANKVLKIIVAIPAFNEEVAIGSVVLRSSKFADQVIVIDDGSKDKTADIAQLAGAEVIKHITNRGKGSAIKDAFEYAARANADILVLIDGDGQHNPDEIPILLNPILNGHADMVNGSRFLNGNGHNVPAYRRIGQKILTVATNTGINTHITDSQNGFRAFSKKTFNIFSFKEPGMAIESEMLMDAAGSNLNIEEVPINVRYDVDGSTLNPVSHGMDVLSKIIRLVSQRRPLLFFCVPGFLVLLVGLFFLIRVFEIFNANTQIAVGSAIIGELCVIIGISSIFTGLMLTSIQSIKLKMVQI